MVDSILLIALQVRAPDVVGSSGTSQSYAGSTEYHGGASRNVSSGTVSSEQSKTTAYTHTEIKAPLIAPAPPIISTGASGLASDIVQEVSLDALNALADGENQYCNQIWRNLTMLTRKCSQSVNLVFWERFPVHLELLGALNRVAMSRKQVICLMKYFAFRRFVSSGLLRSGKEIVLPFGPKMLMFRRMKYGQLSLTPPPCLPRTMGKWWFWLPISFLECWNYSTVDTYWLQEFQRFRTSAGVSELAVYVRVGKDSQRLFVCTRRGLFGDPWKFLRTLKILRQFAILQPAKECCLW